MDDADVTMWRRLLLAGLVFAVGNVAVDAVVRWRHATEGVGAVGGALVGLAAVHALLNTDDGPDT